jgi:hypothetical protein
MDAICQHNNTIRVLEPTKSMHYASIRCADCDHLVRYIPRIENLNLRKRTLEQVQQLLVLVSSQYGKGYLQALLDGGRPDGLKLTPKQREMVQRFKNEHE